MEGHVSNERLPYKGSGSVYFMTRDSTLLTHVAKAGRGVDTSIFLG